MDVGIYEQGDRWKLDVLIPNRDRRLVGPQIPRTDLLSTNTKPVLCTAKIDPKLCIYTPIHTGKETGLEEQNRLRRKYLGDMPLPGDRLLY